MKTKHWIVWCPEYGHEGPDDGMPIPGAYDAQEAVETWAERSDKHSGDYTVIGAGGDTTQVFAKSPDGEVTQWGVYGEQVPSYHASESA